MSAALQRIREHEQRQQAARDFALRVSVIETESLRRERASIAMREKTLPIPRDALGRFSVRVSPRRWWEFWKR